MKFWYTRLYVGYDFASELHKSRNKKEDEEKNDRPRTCNSLAILTNSNAMETLSFYFTAIALVLVHTQKHIFVSAFIQLLKLKRKKSTLEKGY